MRSSPMQLPAKPAEIRCAIYTRKSSEEGLEQEFNSLHAQREACQAYIQSQRHEGWCPLPTLYDDGGISGGTLQRAALARLLEDIRGRRVDLIVIYKVDRLTRSLADFAKLVDLFNAHDVSFVSVTQQFNTATSMGRLTLNMLLSFAQFEREVAGERIRDKIAASKRRGMWMGGYPPLGYDIQERKLVINEAEAEQLRDIYRTYAQLGSVRALRDHLHDASIVSKRRHSATGRESGGRPYLSGNLYEMLRNRLYRGQVAHKGQVYPGEHQAIIDPALWDAVQLRLATNRVDRAPGQSNRQPSLLAGIVYDAAGEKLTPTHATKGRKRYRYYVSRSLITDAKSKRADGQRIPAGALEGLVASALRDLFGSPARLHEACAGQLSAAAAQRQLLDASADLAAAWAQMEPPRLAQLIRTAITRVEVHPDQVCITLLAARLVEVLHGNNMSPASGTSSTAGPLTHIISVPAKLQRAGQEMRLVIGGTSIPSSADPTLAKLVQQGLEFRDQLLCAQDKGIAECAASAGVSNSHFTRVLRLGFLAPDIIAAIAEGQQPVGLTATKLLHDTRLPLRWADQRQWLGFAPIG